MNREVEWAIDDITTVNAGKALLMLVKHQAPGFEKYKEHYFNKEGIPDPIPLFKYSIRLFYLFPSDDRRVTLSKLRKPKDPYRTVSFRWFNGRFEYDANNEAYRPVKISRSGSETMRKLWAAAEQRRINRAWNKARDVLQGKKGEPPKLVAESE
ncbi:hypothetical protein [Fodinibius sediminis]|uniref:Uncharacterized protein n=1 Tax=Fodinibius sediminis TaxID=1214077 RepID=A0A521AVF1_9BACT|nr:hypothetical protein [Fodinibius sediminis]SMO38823.1 hypothetical protein SAMN06265218_101408 [Fodinibius sediminis]